SFNVLYQMLNRRTIRIKIMQSIFAFEQCKEANYQLALDLIEERFKPDLNSMEVQDKALLRQRHKTAKSVFESRFQGTPKEVTEPIITKVVDEAMDLYTKQVKKDKAYLGKNSITEILKLTETYHHTLGLIIAFAEVAASDKKPVHTKLIQLPIIKAFLENEELKKELLRTAGWNNEMNLVRDWFREIVKEDKEYQKFIEQKEVDAEAQRAFLKHLLRKIILASNAINDYFDEQDIRWAEDKDIIKSLADKTIKSFESDKIELQKVSLDWEDDKQFIDKLYENTIELDQEFKDLIASNTKNWEVDRLPLTDRVILEMAIAEMTSFPNIPVKVTINEYIELAKEYSTPKSRQFINGILDVLSKKMKDSGALKKSGRGLIDNK
ncbi:MAG: transcription antitermination factor NusB, partial [Cyclobacteriaceae bacterium]